MLKVFISGIINKLIELGNKRLVIILTLIWCLCVCGRGDGGGGEWVILHPCWFSLNNLKMVRPVTLAFCRILYHFIRDVRAKSGILYSPQSPDLGKKLHGGITDFWISGQSLIKENYHNSRTSDDTNITLGQLTKLDKRNKTTSKKTQR